MAIDTKCAKCGGVMTNGFIFDRGDHEYKRRQTWIEGKPEASFWSGLKTSGKIAYYVEANRCGKCGYLEFYAAEEADLGYFS